MAGPIISACTTIRSMHVVHTQRRLGGTSVLSTRRNHEAMARRSRGVARHGRDVGRGDGDARVRPDAEGEDIGNRAKREPELYWKRPALCVLHGGQHWRHLYDACRLY